MNVTVGRRPRARDLGIRLGTLEPGPGNAITDVGDVRVGHVTIIDEGSASPRRGPARTGVTVVLPHGGNMFKQKVPAAFHVINAFGKAVGATQVQELGVLETPIALTNTLSVGAAFEGLVLHALAANPEIGRSAGNVNPVVAECSDARLNDIRGLVVRPEHVLEAVAAARPGSVAEGSVGAGTGMIFCASAGCRWGNPCARRIHRARRWPQPRSVGRRRTRAAAPASSCLPPRRLRTRGSSVGWPAACRTALHGPERSASTAAAST